MLPYDFKEPETLGKNADYPGVTDGNEPMLVTKQVPLTAERNVGLVIDLPKFMARIIKAEDERSLSVYHTEQLKEYGSSACVYDDGVGHKCIVGAGLPDGFITKENAYNTKTGWQVLESAGIVKVPSVFRDKIRQLQVAHDEAASVMRNSHTNDAKRDALTNMRTKLYALNTEVQEYALGCHPSQK